MDSVFGISLAELILILIVAGLVLGPQQIAQIARHLGRFIGRVRFLLREVLDITRQLGADLDTREDFRQAKEELQSLQKEVAALRRELAQATDQTDLRPVAAGRQPPVGGSSRPEIEANHQTPPVEAPQPLPNPKPPAADALPQPVVISDDPE